MHDDIPIRIPVIGLCPECNGTGHIEDQGQRYECPECRENRGNREVLLRVEQLAAMLYPILDVIDRRERVKRVEQLIREMGD